MLAKLLDKLGFEIVRKGRVKELIEANNVLVERERNWKRYALLLEAGWQDVLKHFWQDEFGEMDYEQFQELGLKHGLLREEPYDPVKHGSNSIGAEAGDSWLVSTIGTSYWEKIGSGGRT